MPCQAARKTITEDLLWVASIPFTLNPLPQGNLHMAHMHILSHGDYPIMLQGLSEGWEIALVLGELYTARG